METLPPGKLRFIPLGGVGEIGKNLYVYHVLDQLLIVDCGLKFPDEKMFGVDLVLPDVRWLVENKAAIQGIVITHGHEDHIGALSFVLPQLGNSVPVYGPALALGLAKNRLGEKRLLDKVKLIEYGPDDVVRKVDQGHLSYRGRMFKISKAFHGYPVALRPTAEDGLLAVYFCQQQVASIDLNVS